jgi:hypothetical protein
MYHYWSTKVWGGSFYSTDDSKCSPHHFMFGRCNLLFCDSEFAFITWSLDAMIEKFTYSNV